MSFIRDAEIESTIRAYAAPLFRIAGLEPDAVDIYLVNDSSLNAFVAGGQKLFINTGLLLRTTDASQVIGVIAHETGHIAGGHLARTQAAMAKISAQNILALVLGGAAAVATGRGDVAGAIISGGRISATRTFLRYSQTQESAADQAALRFLDATGQSAKGLYEFLEVLADQELLSTARQDPYLRTHPLTQNRLDAVRQHLARSPYTKAKTSAKFQMMHRRMVAKLYAFLNPFSLTLRRYKETDNSLESRYARAIAYYRRPDLKKALPLIDGLITEHPDDPYFHELKGQMLYENGRAQAALKPYEAAARLAPTSALIRRDLARVELALEDPALLEPAIRNLRAALQREPQSPFSWRQLAIAYGRKGDMPRSSLALAEEALLTGKTEVARYHAGRAEKAFPRGSAEWLKANDILAEAERTKKKGR